MTVKLFCNKIKTVVVAVQPFAAVAVTLNVPAAKLFRTAPVPPSLHAKVELRLAESCAVPFGASQSAAVIVPFVIINAACCEIVNVAIAVQPVEEVAVTV
jgi:hypothetical protein